MILLSLILACSLLIRTTFADCVGGTYTSCWYMDSDPWIICSDHYCSDLYYTNYCDEHYQCDWEGPPRYSYSDGDDSDDDEADNVVSIVIAVMVVFFVCFCGCICWFDKDMRCGLCQGGNSGSVTPLPPPPPNATLEIPGDQQGLPFPATYATTGVDDISALTEPTRVVTKKTTVIHPDGSETVTIEEEE